MSEGKFSSSSMTVMELSDPEDTVCIELEPMGDNQIGTNEESDESDESDSEHKDDEIYETDVDRVTIFHTLLGEHIETANSAFATFMFFGALLTIICLCIYPPLVLALQNNNTDVWNYDREALGDIYLTKEYQLELKQSLFIPRDEGVAKILNEFAHISGLDLDNVTKHHVGVRSQYKYNPWNCTNWRDMERYEYSEYMSALYYEQYGHGYYDIYGIPLNETNDHDGEMLSEVELRVRNWLSVQIGSNVHTSSIDIKKQVPSQIEAFNIPFRAADDQLEGSTEKLEEDIKPHKYQWSHKSKVTNIPYYPSFSTCRDVLKLWPNCFPDLPEDKYDLEVERKTHSENYWWEEVRESTDPRTGMKWRFTITMEYETFAQALEGRTHPIDEPESSFRIWSTEDGHGPWDYRIVSKVNKWYKELQDKF